MGSIAIRVNRVICDIVYADNRSDVGGTFDTIFSKFREHLLGIVPIFRLSRILSEEFGINGECSESILQ